MNKWEWTLELRGTHLLVDDVSIGPVLVRSVLSKAVYSSLSAVAEILRQVWPTATNAVWRCGAQRRLGTILSFKSMY